MKRMRGVPAVCLVLLLAVGAGIAQDCVQKKRTPGAKNPAKNPVDDNIDCVLNGNCDDDDSCDCVPHYLCKNEDTTDAGIGVINIRMNEADKCVDPLEVCCGKSDQMNQGGDGSSGSGGSGGSGGSRGSGGSSRVVTGGGGKPQPYPPTPNTGCGQRNKDGVGFRITGNTDGEAQFGEFPWMVALLEMDNGVEKFIGGGSLIHSLVVLTAAHSFIRFVKDPSNLRVRAGEWDKQSDAEIIPHQQLEVREVIIHEKFYLGALYNDIALLVLRDEVEPADNVGMLCLPAQGVSSYSDHCIATGWGKDSIGKSGCYQVILKSIPLPIVPHNLCEQQLRRTKLGRKFRLHSSATCAGGKGGKDACKGDGGGPLACPIPGDEEFYEQGGIVSWGIGCGDPGVPGVYTDVSKFRDWVDEKFIERSLETESYQRP